VAAHVLDATNWRLTAYRRDGVLRASPEGIEITLRFEGARVMGSSGCNRYIAQVIVNQAAIQFSPPASTRMQCAPPLMDLEQAYLSGLEAANSLEQTETTLELRDSAGNVALVFAPAGSTP
jgi:heat shock protein HslJ